MSELIKFLWKGRRGCCSKPRGFSGGVATLWDSDVLQSRAERFSLDHNILYRTFLGPKIPVNQHLGPKTIGGKEKLLAITQDLKGIHPPRKSYLGKWLQQILDSKEKKKRIYKRPCRELVKDLIWTYLMSNLQAGNSPGTTKELAQDSLQKEFPKCCHGKTDRLETEISFPRRANLSN